MRIGLILMLALVLPSVGEAGTAGQGEDDLLARLESGSAVVGQPSEIRWQLSERKTGKPVPARLTLTITHLEKGKRIFSLVGIPTKGEFHLAFHFTDGAAHQVTSVAETDLGEPVRDERIVAVAGVEPPREAIFPSLFFFLTVIALGLVAGRISRDKKLLIFTRGRTPSRE